MGWYKPGSWSLWGVPLPELKATETIAKAVGGNPSNLLNDKVQNVASKVVAAKVPGLNVAAKGQVAGASTVNNDGGGGGNNNNNNNNNNNQNNNNNGGGGNGGGGNGGNGDVNNSIDQGAADAEEAARQAAEAKRQAAQRSYQSKVGEAENTKALGKQTYDWIIDTLGSNKKDLLESVNMEETQGVAGYEQQKVETQKNYDNSRQEILATYRDLQREQEKVLRGSGVGQSSRALEATMRLNNLMGKDLSTVSTNEADSLALIGNAIGALRDKSLNLRNKIETDSKSKADQAGLEYQQQINTIDANLNLSANEREDAYAAAESKLADDINSINSWKVNAKLEAEKTIASLKGGVDDFIVDLASEEGSLNKAIADKKTFSDQLINQIDSGLLATETGAEQVNQGQYRRPTSKAELDKQLADGAISEAQYQSMVQTLGLGGGANTMAGGVTANPMEQDKLLQTLMA